MEYDDELVPISMITYSIHGCDRSMGAMRHVPLKFNTASKVEIW